MTQLIKTDAHHPDFITLVQQLDAYLAITDGDEHAFYDQFNQVDTIKWVIVAYEDEKPVGCGAIKAYDSDRAEVKRMYVTAECRGKGVATTILSALEHWAAELSFTKCILETGKRQTEAVAFYQKNGYQRVPNYGQYKDMDNSLCFEKQVKLGN